MMRKFLTVVFVLLLFASCTKNDRSIKVSGNVFDPALNKAVAGATIKLKAAIIESGVYNSNYTEIASTTSDASGNFNMDIAIQKVSGYRFVIIKEDYFDLEEDVNTDDFEKNESYTANFETYPKSSIHLTVQNTSPQGMDDEIKYRYINIESGCKTCCNNNTVTGIGPTYTADNECDVRGEKWIYINWVVTKNGNQHLFSDSIYVEAFKKSNFNIDY